MGRLHCRDNLASDLQGRVSLFCTKHQNLKEIGLKIKNNANKNWIFKKDNREKYKNQKRANFEENAAETKIMAESIKALNQRTEDLNKIWYNINYSRSIEGHGQTIFFALILIAIMHLSQSITQKAHPPSFEYAHVFTYPKMTKLVYSLA